MIPPFSFDIWVVFLQQLAFFDKIPGEILTMFLRNENGSTNCVIQSEETCGSRWRACYTLLESQWLHKSRCLYRRCLKWKKHNTRLSSSLRSWNKQAVFVSILEEQWLIRIKKFLEWKTATNFNLCFRPNRCSMGTWRFFTSPRKRISSNMQHKKTFSNKNTLIAGTFSHRRWWTERFSSLF